MKKFYALCSFWTAVVLLNASTLSAQSTDIPGPSGSGAFGTQVVALPNGNYIVTDPLYDEGGLTDIGAVYLYKGSSHALISTLKGSKSNDKVGSSGITILSNGNYVVISAGWNNGAGAVTWCNSATGINGAVSDGNSLIGNASNQVGSGGISTLSNGNYIVRSPSWDNGGITDAGAVTWGNGATGISGVVGSSNSLVGSTAFDKVGSASQDVSGLSTVSNIVVLSNNNYIVISPFWDNNGATDAGAVTWGNGATGKSGVISSINSLVGSTAGDQVGGIGGEVVSLSNGNYVVSSPNWDNGNIIDVGAVTWGDGASGIIGVVNTDNSLIGSKASDKVGRGGITALNNGNYVVNSFEWDNGAVKNAGAVTWGNGTVAIIGSINIDNSLVGSTAFDQVGGGGIFALSNGNYVVASSNWDNGSISDVGAVTWGNGLTGIKGVVSSSNSLVGSTKDDLIGYTVDHGRVVALANGNYVVASSNWDNGSISDVGAVTWGNGDIGISGEVSIGNSLVGSTEGDGIGDLVTALTNGNYVVSSFKWDNLDIKDAGAATWSNGSTGIKGEISSSNSLVGSKAYDYVAYNGAKALSNGNYVVNSLLWNNGSATQAGAVTWGNGATGISGEVSRNNSLVGSSTDDNVGYFLLVNKSNGSYLVGSAFWDNGGLADAGAVTWGNGATGISGEINKCNSLIGSSPDDLVGFEDIVTLSNGDYTVYSESWSDPNGTTFGAISLGNGTLGTTGFITSCNSVIGVGATSNGSSNMISSYNYQHNYLIVGKSNGNLISILKPADCQGCQDSDKDGIPDDVDIDDDNDGIPDVLDGPGDTDGDGIPDRLDLDSDADGILDIREANPNIPTVSDSDGNGRVDNPVDSDGDGLADVVDKNPDTKDNPATPAEGAGATKLPVPDTDGDGEPDFQDVDSDNDGIKDLVEGFNNPALSANNDIDGMLDQTDTDGDGIADVIDPDNGGTPAITPDTDEDGVPDFRDLDSDDDGLKDVKEAGLPDSDGDGLVDDRLAHGTLPDEDSDGIPDFREKASFNTLPVKWISVTASLQNASVVTNWKSAEVNLDYYVVERSVDGHTFTPVGKVQGQHNGRSENTYSFTDINAANLNQPVLYYRIVSVDFVGTKGHSKVVATYLSGEKKISMFPNPTKGKIWFNHLNNVESIDVYNEVGALVKRYSLNNGQLSYDFSQLANGMYLVKLNRGKLRPLTFKTMLVK